MLHIIELSDASNNVYELNVTDQIWNVWPRVVGFLTE